MIQRPMGEFAGVTALRGGNPGPTRHEGRAHAGLHRLFDETDLLRDGPAYAALDRRDHFDTRAGLDIGRRHSRNS